MFLIRVCLKLRVWNTRRLRADCNCMLICILKDWRCLFAFYYGVCVSWAYMNVFAEGRTCSTIDWVYIYIYIYIYVIFMCMCISVCDLVYLLFAQECQSIVPCSFSSDDVTSFARRFKLKKKKKEKKRKDQRKSYFFLSLFAIIDLFSTHSRLFSDNQLREEGSSRRNHSRRLNWRKKKTLNKWIGNIITTTTIIIIMIITIIIIIINAGESSFFFSIRLFQLNIILVLESYSDEIWTNTSEQITDKTRFSRKIIPIFQKTKNKDKKQIKTSKKQKHICLKV